MGHATQEPLKNSICTLSVLKFIWRRTILIIVSMYESEQLPTVS